MMDGPTPDNFVLRRSYSDFRTPPSWTALLRAGDHVVFQREPSGCARQAAYGACWGGQRILRFAGALDHRGNPIELEDLLVPCSLEHQHPSIRGLHDHCHSLGTQVLMAHPADCYPCKGTGRVIGFGAHPNALCPADQREPA